MAGPYYIEEMKDNKDTEHEGKTFEKIQGQEKVVSGRKFTECIFKHCQLNGLVFEDCQFTDCVFEDCDLSLLAVKRSFFHKTQILRSKAIGINWYEARSIMALQFTDTMLSYSSFFGKALKKMKFKNCVAKEVDFSDCVLTEADFGGTDLEGARFSGCDLSLANFREARNYSIDVLNNKVKKAKFSLPEALALLDSFDVVVE